MINTARYLKSIVTSLYIKFYIENEVSYINSDYSRKSLKSLKQFLERNQGLD